MAHYAAGVTASWMGTAFGDITELRSSYGGNLPLGRGTANVAGGTATATATSFALDLGNIEVFSLSTAALSIGSWGRKGVLAIGGTARNHTATATVISVGFTTKAICTQLQATGKVQDVWRYQGTFRIVKE